MGLLGLKRILKLRESIGIERLGIFIKTVNYDSFKAILMY